MAVGLLGLSITHNSFLQQPGDTIRLCTETIFHLTIRKIVGITEVVEIDRHKFWWLVTSLCHKSQKVSTQLCHIFVLRNYSLFACLSIFGWKNSLERIFCRKYNKIFSLTHMISVSRKTWVTVVIISYFGELSPFSYFCKTFDGLVGIDLCSEQGRTLLMLSLQTNGGHLWQIDSLFVWMCAHVTEHLRVCDTQCIAIHRNPLTCR